MQTVTTITNALQASTSSDAATQTAFQTYLAQLAGFETNLETPGQPHQVSLDYNTPSYPEVDSKGQPIKSYSQVHQTLEFLLTVYEQPSTAYGFPAGTSTAQIQQWTVDEMKAMLFLTNGPDFLPAPSNDPEPIPAQKFWTAVGNYGDANGLCFGTKAISALNGDNGQLAISPILAGQPSQPIAVAQENTPVPSDNGTTAQNTEHN
jgi:hypothetical protein